MQKRNKLLFCVRFNDQKTYIRDMCYKHLVMFKSTKPCLCKETNGSYSNAVIGILIITVTLSMGLSVLGVWANALDGTQEDSFDLPFIPEKKSLEDIISQETSSENKFSEGESGEVSVEALMGLCDVPVPECGEVGQFDTVPGTLEINEAASVLPVGPLPLCINNDYLDDYFVIVESLGGYKPLWGKIYIDQMKGGICYEGKLIAKFTEITTDGCPCIVTYNVTFTTTDPICLDSNHVPLNIDPDQTQILGKWVDVEFKSEWMGCQDDYQKFMVILAHKAMSQNPKLPIYYTSPVKS